MNINKLEKQYNQKFNDAGNEYKRIKNKLDECREDATRCDKKVGEYGTTYSLEQKKGANKDKLNYLLSLVEKGNTLSEELYKEANSLINEESKAKNRFIEIFKELKKELGE